jgi:UDP:flavonoid glycosyltransferase YjiC (YdhE family)
MQVTVIGFGTRGDVLPLAALATRLRESGRTIRMATHAEFESTATSLGFEFRPVPGSYQQLVSTSEGRRALGVPNNSPLGLTGLFRPFRDCAEAVFRHAWDASADADAIVSSPLASLVTGAVAAARNVPLVIASPIPPIGSRYLSAPAFPLWRLGPLYNLATHALTRRLVQYGARSVFAAWEREAIRIASPTSNRPPRMLTLVAASPLVVPRPVDWPDSTHVTGYWFPPAPSAGVPPRVRAFVESGPPPICLGFGSMADDDPERLRAIVLDAIGRLGVRAVIVGGSGSALAGFGDQPNVCEAPFVDYDWLFRRVSVVVHQGGAGTAAYCFAAGIPQAVVPYCLDHAFWSGRLHEMGVAPAPVKRSRLTTERLAAMIQQAIGDPKYRQRAATLAPHIAAEDGLGRAVRLVIDHFDAATASRSY